ncbi:MAG: hypothetical protein ACU0CO_07795 [Shimia sp.]
MRHFLTTTILATALTLVQATTAGAQMQQTPEAPATFSAQNAILDTGVPFAAGARQTQQNLRGAFGWATFQEGLVHGVYFRFDPDGYARFSPSPRLDSDVFEVICRPRTTTCLARKGRLSMTVNDRGQLQPRLPGVTDDDTYFLDDGYSELQVPSRVVGPLDPQLETLLSAGGDLVVKRNGAETERVSLAGFAAVGGYLRWVAARQDHAVLPANWPVPAAQTGPMARDEGLLAEIWGGGAPAPSATGPDAGFPDRTVPRLDTAGLPPAPTVQRVPGGDPAIAALQSQVALLHDLLLARTAADRDAVQPGPAPRPAMAAPSVRYGAPSPSAGPIPGGFAAAPGTQVAPMTPMAPAAAHPLDRPVAAPTAPTLLDGALARASQAVPAWRGPAAPPPLPATYAAAPSWPAPHDASDDAGRPTMGVSGAQAHTTATYAVPGPQPLAMPPGATPIGAAASHGTAEGPEIGHLRYLTTTMGLDTQTALTVLQLLGSGADPRTLMRESERDLAERVLAGLEAGDGLHDDGAWWEAVLDDPEGTASGAGTSLGLKPGQVPPGFERLSDFVQRRLDL